jgi:hypothetical protein
LHHCCRLCVRHDPTCSPCAAMRIWIQGACDYCSWPWTGLSSALHSGPGPCPAFWAGAMFYVSVCVWGGGHVRRGQRFVAQAGTLDGWVGATDGPTNTYSANQEVLGGMEARTWALRGGGAGVE